MVFGWGKKKQEREDVHVENVSQSKEISLSEIPGILSDIGNLRMSQTLKEINRLRNETEPLMGDLTRIGNLLEKDNLKTGDIDKHIAIIVVRGKQQVIDVIKKGVVSLPKISNIDDAKKLDAVLGAILKKVGDVLGRQTRVIHIFAKKYASQLKENLEVMNGNHAEISRLLKNLDTTQYLHSEISDALERIRRADEVQKENSQKILEAKDSVKILDEKISETEGYIKKIHSSDGYGKYLDLKSNLDGFVGEKAKIKNDLNLQFTKISRPLSRYEYASSLDKEQKSVLSGLIAEPFDIITSENKDSIIIILENVRKGVSNGSISVKDVDKTSNQIMEIEESLEVFAKRISEYHETYKQMQSDLDSAMPAELVSLDAELANSLSLRDDLVSKSKTFQDEMDETDKLIPKLMSEVERNLRKFSNTKYIVLKS